jgi:hypothetical protein
MLRSLFGRSLAFRQYSESVVNQHLSREAGLAIEGHDVASHHATSLIPPYPTVCGCIRQARATPLSRHGRS